MTDLELFEALRATLVKERWVNEFTPIPDEPNTYGVQTYDGDLIFLIIARP